MRLSIPSVSNPDVAPAINAIKEVLEVGLGVRGDPSDRFLLVRDLTATGLATTSSGGLVPVDPANGEPVDLTPPAALTGLTATGSLTVILLEWNPSTAHNYAYTELWRSETNDRNAAVRVGVATGNLYADPVSMDSVYFYWVRAVSSADVVGAWNSAFDAGTPGQTQAAAGAILGVLTEQIRQDQIVWREQVVYETDLFAIVAPRSLGDTSIKTPFVVGTVDGVSTVGINGQLIVDGTILTNAIAAKTVTADKIMVLSLSAIAANLGVVTAGTLDVGVSSWKVKISSDGYPLEYRNVYSSERRFYFDDLGNAYFKGAIEALSGSFTGAIKSGSTITGASIVGGTLNVGSPGFHIASNGDAWAGHANYASAPFRVETSGAVHSGLGTSSTHMSNGMLWTGSSGFSTAPFRVDANGDLVANSIKQAKMVADTGNPQPQIINLHINAANVVDLTADKIEAGVLGAGVVVAGSLIAGEITAGTIGADNVTAGVLGAGVVVAGSLIAGDITAATINAQRISGDVNIFVPVRQTPNITAPNGSWVTVWTGYIPASSAPGGHTPGVALSMRMSSQAQQRVAGRVLMGPAEDAVEVCRADVHLVVAATLPLNGGLSDKKISSTRVVVQAMALDSGGGTALVEALAGLVMGVR